ncbi:hypothetical protein DWB85_15955 [Seongchinamella sediminis]|uniref:Uncharacterized protein n=1 Tax=Seongchinamella sediminis TaxID=2283635 RepID=A0A3L7DUG0_9GAMM|nr:hypothetical protein [Seongchinamella sediminis]RLQ20746.1 hypothetical protein DWB85_15955 [Seongchinamella sediminis]
MKAVWVSKQPPHILVEDIDGFLVCYCAATGQTHILDAFPAEILRSLMGGSLSLEEIKQHLSELLEEEIDWTDKVCEVLSGLQKLQLVDVRAA